MNQVLKEMCLLQLQDQGKRLFDNCNLNCVSLNWRGVSCILHCAENSQVLLLQVSRSFVWRAGRFLHIYVIINLNYYSNTSFNTTNWKKKIRSNSIKLRYFFIRCFFQKRFCFRSNRLFGVFSARSIFCRYFFGFDLFFDVFSFDHLAFDLRYQTPQ